VQQRREVSVFCRNGWLASAGLWAFFVTLPLQAGLVPPMNGNPSDFAVRRAGAEVSASYRIGITNSGIYRINQSTLAAAGLTNMVGSQVRMFCQTQEVAIYVSTDSAFTTNDYILFYGQGFNGYYTTENAYWIGLGSSGLRMSSRSGLPLATTNEIRTYTETVTYAPNNIYRPFYRPSETNMDHWYAAVLLNTNINILVRSNFSIRTQNIVTPGVATLSILLHGITSYTNVSPDHKTWAEFIVGVAFGGFEYDGMSDFSGSASVSSTQLTEGTSTMYLSEDTLNPNVPLDEVYLESFSLSYPRYLIARNSDLAFTGRGGNDNYTITGFPTNRAFWVLDVTDPANPVQITNLTIQPTSNVYGVRFGDPTGGPANYRVDETAGILTVTQVQSVAFRNLGSTNWHADYILIGVPTQRRNGYRLLKQRFLQGLSVVVAPPTDIYNEFSYGIKDADAIKEFLGYTFHHWQGPPPKYVLLAGQGSYDPKNNLQLAIPDIVPTHLGPTSTRWSALDGWFVTVNGADMLPDMAIGRIAASTDAFYSNVVNKTLAYEALSKTNTWRTKALLVADQKDSDFNFTTSSELNVYSYLSSGFTCQKAYYDTDGGAAVTRSLITNSIDGGRYCVSYIGHGAMDLWSNSDIFDTNDVPKLSNSVFPLFTIFTCENGEFEDPTLKCLAETLIEAQNHGAVACVAPSSLSIGDLADQFANGFYGALVNASQYSRVGDVMGQAYLKLYNYYMLADELQFYEVIGDPALVLKPSQ